MKVSVTGHRPGKLFTSFPYSSENYRKLVDFCKEKIVKPAKKKYPDVVFITGMALGLDMAIADACQQEGVPFKAYVPFKGQETKWHQESQSQYIFLLTCAEEIVICSEGGYTSAKMHIRNERMVEDADITIALWNGDQQGGTAACVAYAKKQGKYTKSFWKEWIAYRDN